MRAYKEINFRRIENLEIRTILKDIRKEIMEEK